MMEGFFQKTKYFITLKSPQKQAFIAISNYLMIIVPEL